MIKLILQFNLFIFSMCSAIVSFGQTPPLGSAEDFVLFTAVGAFNNTGVSTVVIGDVGTNVGAFNAFPPGTLVGQIHVADPVSVLAAIDVDIAYNFLVAQTCGQVLTSGLGNGQILNPRIYCIGEASTINGNLILDGQCNPDAVFIFQIDGALSTSTFSTVTFINGASVCNVYWQVNGQVTLGENSVFRGNIIANGALNLLENSSLFGRGLSREGAISLSTTNVDINQLPTPSTIMVNVAGPYCAGESLTLSGNCGGSWSTGSTGSELTVTVSGDYFVTNTNDCGSAISNHILINFTELPACNISGDVSICNGEQTELCVSGGSTYIWTTGATTNCITTGTAGIYEVTITDVNGCTSVCNTTVINSLSECTITGANVVCPGASTQLCVSGGVSYVWSTGASSDCITTGTEGTYSVTITDVNGCTSVCNTTVTVNPLPACTITGANVLCPGASTQLCVSGGVSYVWSTGASSDCITTGTEGTYSVTITDVNGCTSVCNTTVTVNPLPACTITGANVLCPGANTQLCVSGGSSYIWTTGATTDCISTGTAGTYTVTITDVNGCTSVCNTTVTVNPLPACTITGANVLCPGASTQLCVSGGSSYIWTTGATTDCISTGTEGTYSVTIADINGCTSVCNTTVTVNPLPACTITGTNILCQGSSTQLCVSGGASYIWSTGATTNCITTGTAGTYMVTITDINGCTSVCSKTVNVDPAPVCAISGSDTFCLGQSSVICAIGGNNYQWSNGEITPCITVSVAGTYTVTITDSYGCTSVCNKTMVELTTIPYCFIEGETYFCLGDSTEICGPTGPFTYLWSSGEIAETTRCISVYETGTYTLTITDSNGCTNVCSKEVIETEFPVCEITGNTVICEGDSTQLCLPPGYFDYWWEDGKQSNCITVTEPGVYAITVTHIARCQSICSTTVTLLTLPEVVISGNNVFCEGQSSLLCVDGNPENIIWSNGDTTNCITVLASGTYSVTATNHCDTVVSNQIVVTMNPLPVASVINSDSSTIICEGDTITLSGNVNGVWNTGETSPSIEVSSSGTYFVTNANTCDTVVSNQIVVTVSPSPVASLINSNSSTEICDGDTITLSGNVNGIWNTGETSQSIEVSSSGTYFVTNANTCDTVVSNQIVVTVSPSPVASSINSESSTEFCEGEIITLSGNINGMWNTGETSPSIEVSSSGTYFVTNANECGTVVSNSVEVSVTAMPQCHISGNLNPDHDQTTILCAPAGYKFYLWNTLEVSQCISVIESGFKSVTISNNTICVDSCEVLVVYKEVTGTIDSKYLEEQLKLKISPNPFNLTTTIEFQNPFPDLDVTIDIYHISGVKVNTFKRFESTTKEMQSIIFDGDKLDPGIYLCKINVGNLSFYKKMILLR